MNRSISLATLNGDGRADLALANNGSGTVSILLGKGNGRFGAPVDYSTGGCPTSVTVADLNGDGKADVAAVVGCSNNVLILEGTGNGRFVLGLAYALEILRGGLAVADLNGDGRPDLAVANYDSSSLSVLLNLTPVATPDRAADGSLPAYDDSLTVLSSAASCSSAAMTPNAA